jgi:YaiO family outer membrane protein
MKHLLRRNLCLLGPLLIGLGMLSYYAPAHAETEEAPRSGSIEAGVMFHSLSNGYGVWNGRFLRGVLTDKKNVWSAELADLSQFNDRGQLIVAGVTHTLNEDWFVSGSAATSSSGFSLPRLRLDATANYKWFEKRNLVTTLGLGFVDSKDGHRDRSVLLGAAYYFERPLVVEGGIRFNHSNPGSVQSNAKYIAATYGQDKQRLISLRYGFGQEAYQLIGNEALLTNFSSNVLTLTWRKWIQTDLALQIRMESYRNPFYDRKGLEFSVIKEF